MSFPDNVLNHYAAAPEAVREALAAALAAAEKAVPAPEPDEGQASGAAHQGAKAGPQGAAREPLSFEAARPDVMLAKRCEEIVAAEGVDYAEAMRLAGRRDPELLRRYVGENAAREAPQVPAVGTADVELAERATALVEAQGLSYDEATRLVLGEDPGLGSRYLAAYAVPDPVNVSATAFKTPPGRRLITQRPDVQLAERVRSRQERDGAGYLEALNLELAADPALQSRYRDFATGRTALDEAAYRAETIRAAAGGRVTPQKALDAALAEDPQLRAGVEAYYEQAT